MCFCTTGTAGSKYLAYDPGSEINLFFSTMNNETKVKQRTNEDQTTNKINEQ
jgi:hypothetical protein